MAYTAQEQQSASLADLSFEAFGVMTARRGAEQVPLGPPRHRAVLALLLIRLGQVVPADQLVDELWGDSLPRRPQATLQTYLSHLRRVLTGQQHGPVTPLRYQAPGYVLTVEPTTFDLSRFESLVSCGQRHVADGRLQSAREVFDKALRLWRADPFLDLTAYTPLAEEGARLSLLRTTAVAAHADTLLALGEAGDAVALLRREVSLHPTDERLVGSLMTGLYRLGRQAEALQLYDRTRAYLAEELGVAPARELQHVHMALLRHELDDQAPAPALVEVRERPEAPAEREADAPAAVPQAEQRRAAPTAYSAFPCRDDALDALRSSITGALRGSGHITAVVGEAGVGKTELVVRATTDSEPPPPEAEVIRVNCRAGEGTPVGWVWQQVLRRLETPYGTSFDGLRKQCVLHPMTTLSGHGVEQPSHQLHFLVQDALCEAVLQCADDRPLLLVLEDAHRADRLTLDVLGLLSNRTQGRPVSVVITVREPGLGAGPDADGPLMDLLADSRTKVVHLGNLAEEHVRAAVTAQAGPGVDASVVRALYERSAGNPYLLDQLLADAGGARRLHDPQVADVVRAGIPTGIRSMLRRRFAGLPPRVVQILKCCAVLGTEATLASLTGMLDDGGADHDLVEEVMGTGLMESDRDRPHRLVFRYGLIRDVLLAEMRHQERAALHARAVGVLSAWHGDSPEASEEVARHAWEAALALPAEDVVPHLRRAGEQAIGDGDYQGARTWFEHAHTLLCAAPRTGDAASEQTLDLRTELFYTTSITRGYGDHQVEVEAGRIRKLSAGRTTEQAALLLRQFVAELVTGRPTESARHVEQLRVLAERSGAPEIRFYEQIARGLLRLPSETADALTALTEAEHTADGLSPEQRGGMTRRSQHDPRYLAMNHRVLTLWLLGATDDARALCDELLAATGRDGTPVDRASAYYFDSLVAALGEDAHRAAASSGRGLDIAGAHGLSHWTAMLQVCQGWARQQTGEPGALAGLESAVAELRERRLLIRLPLHLGLLAQAQHSSGAVEDARRTLRSSAAEVESRGEFAYAGSGLPFTRLRHLTSAS
ncbi:AfsR/SARP family transcriptional regulator [Streptomyces acidiscabies]|uniref:BTAD domain-containing putative transcriptional regulator n=5 Tax=Streptomyces acidiscabies TaxID=42234 RepID=A0AAP6EEX0_9ACTN|nr:AfsR/SARP family transcriptional regulator [Streptomyces acidiscabies]MBZ3916046.1 AAA family ATPase [Streptomyces acidiscabies]MDX2960437.1 BTAD domain-containing putative transcriptional regulator [Streptomyces acidiscabies]MDX3017723.1 BTAD domain-containing putative transcriptional regulator [Streptomyces acidiscabies]MDX3794348.1 BTAD domain-containing putative transcriptional regulator [Streptomyces acidiscabies]